ncbi:coth protein-domain-containing protein [Phycomyces nitens]|nr:coth protein-domain-containing protein [Phycomyces nitens]
MRLTLVAFAIATVVSAVTAKKQITYSVVSLEGGQQDMSVIVDNVSYPLVPLADTPILYTGTAPVASHGYSYAITTGRNSMKVEPFTRKKTNKTTPNETFGRSWNTRKVKTVKSILPPLKALDRLDSPLHIDGEIPTVYLSGDQSAFDNMHQNAMQDITVSMNMSYISPGDIKVFPDVELELSGRSSRWFPKVSYNIKLKKKAKNHLYSYRRLKLRSVANDDSYLRERIGYDIINAVGLASTKYSYVRVVMNDKPLGLYGFIEAFQNPWLQNEFSDGDEDYENGPLYQGKYLSAESIAVGASSDLAYYGNNLTMYELGQYNLKEDPAKGEPSFQPLMDFTKFIYDAPTNTSDAVKVWQKTFDTDSFLRSMALEVLMGYSDGYITMANNYYIYFEPKSSRYIYIPSDIDMTLGSSFFKASDVTSGNYSTYPSFHTRPLLNKILQVPGFKSQFEDLIYTITKKLFNVKKLSARIDDQAKMIAEDVAWDKISFRPGKDLMADGSADSMLDYMGQTSIDIDTAKDYYARSGHPVPFEVAIEGPTGHLSMPGLKEYIRIQSENTLKFYKSKK